MNSTGATPPLRAGTTAKANPHTGPTARGRAFNGDVRRARRIFRKELGLTPGASLQQLVDAIADHNQRPITIQEMDLDPALSGLCLRGPSQDRIIISRDNTPWQRLRVKIHELGHLLPWITADQDDCCVSGHAPGHSIQLRPDHLNNQLTTLPPDVVHDVLNATRPPKLRAAYDSGEELAVEAWATAIPRLLATEDDTNAATDAITSAFSNRAR
ncbi:hypothetical protein [Streptomyces sp. NPDC045251]|uniref:hypothetical protein n=1 Tax=unclassified Streptomyces TaxID=2593676 RepID=UPI0033C60150